MLIMVSIFQRGNTPLHAAVSSNQTDCIRVLKYYHADVYVENKACYME